MNEQGTAQQGPSSASRRGRRALPQPPGAAAFALARRGILGVPCARPPTPQWLDPIWLRNCCVLCLGCVFAYVFLSLCVFALSWVFVQSMLCSQHINLVRLDFEESAHVVHKLRILILFCEILAPRTARAPRVCD